MKGHNIIYSALIYTLIFIPITVLADSRYIIKDILIEIDDTNVTDIRNNAILKAQLEGYKRMILPIVHPDDYNKLFSVENIIINSLVSGVELKEELILKNKYKANFTINFNPLKVEELFKKNQILYSVIESKPISIIPILKIDSNKLNLENVWYNSWIENNTSDDLFNFDIIKRLNLSNPTLSVEDLLSLNINDEPSIKNLNNNIFIWANLYNKADNPIKMNIIIKSIFNKKEITFTKEFASLENEIENDFINRSVKTLRQDLFNLWVQNTSSIDVVNPFKFRYLSNDLKTWTIIENKLLDLESIKELTIEYYDLDSLQGTIYFSGNLDKLSLIMTENDILFTYLGKYSDISLIE